MRELVARWYPLGLAIVLVAFVARRAPAVDDRVLTELSSLEHRMDRIPTAQRPTATTCPSISLPSTPIEPSSTAIPAQPAQPTPQAVKALDDAQVLIANSANRGSWTADDRQELRRLLPSLPPGASDDVFLELVRGINEQRIHLAFPGSPI